ncbi:hypothetical protein [Nocardia carnea]|uniref:hypothetical protein n=1 Tax=Nocardia carnea TaxID=37328 RepID=UPI0024558324|nr:hypothetical protein [Nocardia carnea]
MSTEANPGIRAVTAGRAFQELDRYLAETDDAFCYDVEIGLKRLKRSLDFAAQPSRATHIDASITATDWLITSDVTVEHAYRDNESDAAGWRLSWLPDRPLTREQALAGMMLDVLVSDPESALTEIAEAEAHAVTLGIRFEQAVILLAQRIEERLRIALGEADRSVGTGGGTEHAAIASPESATGSERAAS